jgi:hypothetical protein
VPRVRDDAAATTSSIGLSSLRLPNKHHDFDSRSGSQSALETLYSTRKCRPRIRTTSLTTRHRMTFVALALATSLTDVPAKLLPLSLSPKASRSSSADRGSIASPRVIRTHFTLQSTRLVTTKASLSIIAGVQSLGICTKPDSKMVNEPFCSFFSGHFTMAWAGMLYLTLFLCFKFAIVISFCYQTASS